MDLALVIKHRLEELSLEQRDLAGAAGVTESYISQLLARRKIPPAPGRTRIYQRAERFLRLSAGELSQLAAAERKELLKKRVAGPPHPLFPGLRELVLRKCHVPNLPRIRALFEKEPLGELERLVTQQLIEIARQTARTGLQDPAWLRTAARLSGRRPSRMRAILLSLVESAGIRVESEHALAFLDPLIEWWDLDLKSFTLEIQFNPALTAKPAHRLEFVESDPRQAFEIEPGFEAFLRDPAMSATATVEEIEFLKRLRFHNRRPTPLYYYRELQNLRDPLHFSSREAAVERASR